MEIKSKHVFFLFGCVLLIAVILSALYAFSPLSERPHRSSFKRRFASETLLTERASVDLGFNSFYFAGLAPDKIYLGNYSAPLLLEYMNTSLTEIEQVRVKLPELDSLPSPARLRMVVDSPYFFVNHGGMPLILRGRVGSWEARAIMPDSDYYFVDAEPLSANSLVLRSFSTYFKGYQLAKKTSLQAPYFKFNHDLLQRQGDGVFSVDGELLFSKELKRVIYIYSYRSQYIVADTSLNLFFRGRTIDTFNTANVSVLEIPSQNKSVLASLPTIVNGHACVSFKYLFVQSNLLSASESEERFERSSVVDIYDLSQGRYVESFYIPDFKNLKMTDFRVVGKRVIIMFSRYLVVYEMNEALPT